MKTQAEIEAKIKEIENAYEHVLTGSVATVIINAPRALEQLAVQSRLETLHWVIGRRFRSKLKGVDR